MGLFSWFKRKPPPPPDPNAVISQTHDGLKGVYHLVMGDGREFTVCDTCGGNCGQCGMTEYFSRMNPGGTPPADMNFLIKTTHMDQPVAGLGKRP